MKPTVTFTGKTRSGLGEREYRRGSALPNTDYSFQAASVAKGGARRFGACRPSFHQIGRDYFQNEAPREFAGEAALFVVIVATAILPILSNLSAWAHLVRVYTVL